MEQKKERRLIPVTKWNDYHPWPPIGGLRHLIFYEKPTDLRTVSCVWAGGS